MYPNATATRLTVEDKSAIRAFWQFYEPRRASIAAQVLLAAYRIPEWSSVLSRSVREQASEQDEELHRLQRAAILDDQWMPYLTTLHARGEHYAQAGISYSAWFALIRAYQDEVEKSLQREALASTSVLVISKGLNLLLHVTVECIGEAYLDATHRIVARIDARYHAMFDQSPLPMWMFDRDTMRFVMVNDAAIQHYGYSRDEFIAMTIADIRPPEEMVELREDLARARGFRAGRIWQHRKKDGTMISVEVRANDFDLDGRPVRLVLITDVTARLKAEKELQETQDHLRHSQKMEAMGRLAGGVAHDFNNILTVVQSYACILEESLDASDARREDAAEIRRASERAHAITRQLLTMSRHSAVAPRAICLDEIVAGFVPMLRRLLGDAVTLITHRRGVPKVLADPGQIEQVLMNLAVNARDAMPAGGRFTIESRTVDIDVDTSHERHVEPGQYVELAVTDTGTGIDPGMQSRIFEPFFTTKEAGKGTGIGLSIAHGIVCQAGGSISVYSERGHGTTFRVYLPVTEEVAAVRTHEVVAAPRTLPPMRILVVDDQADVRAVAERILRDAGCRVIEAATAEQARRICVSDDEAIDLVLLDVVLPDSQGESLARQLRELRPELKLLQMSGYPAGALTPYGAFPELLLCKPFSPSQLRGAVAQACELSKEATTGIDAVVPNGKTVRRALVADDDDSFRRAIDRILRKADFDVTAVDSGSKAISALEKRSFDVVVSDVQMPDGGGLDLLRAVRRIDLDVPVILMTGEPSLAAAAQAVEYGAFRYLTKPIDQASFVKVVEYATRAHALARLRREVSNVSATHPGAADRAGLEVRFDHALDGLWMAFQPIVHARTGALFGVEALLRTAEPSLPTPPAVLDAGEQLGKLAMLGRKVRRLCGESLAQRSDITMFVNLHPDDLQDVDLIDARAALSTVATRVILEVTERASLDTSRKLVERVAHLRELGFRIAVDDIGAGYSGLSSFTELTPEVVKIDMSLVRDVHTSSVKQRTINALCRLCHEVDTLVVGEGVETIEERDMLVSLGCDLLQGYLLGRPDRMLPR